MAEKILKTELFIMIPAEDVRLDAVIVYLLLKNLSDTEAWKWSLESLNIFWIKRLNRLNSLIELLTVQVNVL